MSSFRKISTFLLWLLLIAAILSGFLWVKTRNLRNIDPLYVLPKSATIIFEINSLPGMIAELQDNNKMWKELSISGSLKEAFQYLNRLDSILQNEAQIKELLSKRLIVSLSLKTNRSMGILFCLPVSVTRQDKVFLKIISKQIPGIIFSKRRYEGNTIYDLSWKQGKENRYFSFAVLKGVMAGSFSSELVEEAARQLNSGSNITSSPEFTSINKTAGSNVPVNVFVNYKNVPEIAEYFVNPTFTKQLESIKNFASWGALDAEIFTDKLIFNGFTSMNDSLNEESGIFIGQEPIEFRSPEFLPEAVGYFKIYGFSDKALFFKKLSGFLQKNPDAKDNLKRKRDILNKYDIELDKIFTEMLGGEFGYAGMQSGRTSFPFFFMKLKSQSLAEQQFRGWIKAWALKNNKNPNELVMDYKIDNNNTLPVFKLPIGGIPSMVFGPGFSSPGNDYFTFINNYLVFANSYNSMKDFIYQVVLGNTLASGASYSSLGENLSSRSNIYFFAKPSAIMDNEEELLSGRVIEFLKNTKEGISKFNAITSQYSAADELMYNHVFINFAGVSGGNVNTVWESRIDTSTVFKPAIVVNHITGEKEIFIQDRKNQIYLLSNAGVIHWKQMLDGPINSEVFQVDFFDNGKLQYLFSTRTKIYLLDRNGNAVEKFPVDFRSPASAGISVFEYGKDEPYRICVPCEDRLIYLYDKEGKIIPGWQPERTDHLVMQPLQYFRVGTNDYIVAIDKYKFYILDRKGKNRVDVEQYFQVSNNNCFYLDAARGNEMARLVTTDTSGSIMRVYFSGKVEKILDRKIDPGHHFVYSDLDGDQKGEYLTASGKILQVLDPFLKESFKIEFNDVISYRPVIYKFSTSDNKIGIVLKNPGNIYLYNNNGNLYNGFPLVGSAQFSISSFPELGGRFNMIVGAKNNFLYNYSVQ